jgi:hypothetical protein
MSPILLVLIPFSSVASSEFLKEVNGNRKLNALQE